MQIFLIIDKKEDGGKTYFLLFLLKLIKHQISFNMKEISFFKYFLQNGCLPFTGNEWSDYGD